MSLTFRVTGADEYGTYLKCLFCGDPGSGKTRSSSTFPRPMLASVNANLMSVADRQLPYVSITSSRDLLQLRHMLDNPPEERRQQVGVEVETLIVDTIDHFQHVLISERKRDEKKDALSGADFGWLGDEMRAVVRGLRNLPLHVVFLCHLKVTEDMETNRVYLRPSLQGALGDEIAGYVDIALAFKAATTLEVAPDGSTSERVVHRFAQTYPDPQLPWVRDNSGKLPPEFNINFDDDFDRHNTAVFGSVSLPASSSIGVVDESAVARNGEAPSSTGAVGHAKAPAAATAAPVAPPAEASVPASSAPSAPPPAPVAPAAPTEEQAAAEVAQELVNEMPTAPTEVELPPCEECSGPIESEDQLDLARLRFRRPLCVSCFRAAKGLVAR